MAIIEVHGLKKSYGPKQVLDGVDLSVDEGEIVGVLGPNGSGKSTMIECIGGLRVPDAGTISVAGIDPTKPSIELREELGMQLQQCRLPPKIKVHEALELYASFYRLPRPSDELLERFDLQGQREQRFDKLSGGQQQRLSVALALIGRPRIAFLDELTTGLDPQARRDIWEYLAQLRHEGVTMLLVTHFMEEAQYLCDRVVILDDAHIIANDSPDRIAAASGAQQTTFDLPAGFDPAILRTVAGVTDVRINRGRVLVTGDAESPQAVLAALAGAGVTAHGLRVTSPSLDDAYLALTNDPHHNKEN